MSWACSSCGGDNPEGMRFCGHCGTPAEQAAKPPADPDVSEALKSFVSQQVAEHLVASGGEITEERRLVTALFADLSGFTPLADRLDPEELLEIIDPIIQRLTNIVGRYEGYVDKFAGDALMAFFGAPVAHEDDAQRALMVASEMHQEIRRILPDLPEDAGELTLHIGVNSGRVVARVLGTEVRMDYSVLGDAVILAQRLESAAPPNETYVGETTYELTREHFDFESVGELTLKGKSEPVPAWRLVGRKRSWDARRDNTFVGRDGELQIVDAALSGLSDGRGAVISVSGEPGVGKSRFTAEVRRRAEAHGAAWLTTRCLSYGAGIPYWPLAELFRRVAGLTPNDAPDEALERLTATLAGGEVVLPYFARMLGLPAARVDDLEPEAYRRGLHEAVAHALTEMTGRHPVVVVVEDLHWADSSSVALATDLARLCRAIPLVIYLTARTEAVGALLDIASGADESLRHAIQLDPLDVVDVGPLAEGFLGAPLDRAAIDLVVDRAGGNPFFARELLRSLQDASDLVHADGAWVLAEGFDPSRVPATIEGVVSARIDVLPRPAASTLQISSVIGRRVRVPLLHAVDEAPDVEANLTELLRAELLDPSEQPDELVFHHALVQDVAYSRLLRKRRRELHLRVAEEAERLYGARDDTIDLLARHLHLAEAGDKAIEYLTRAGERARRLYANDEAIIHLGHALDLARKSDGAPELVPPLLLSLADVHELVGRYDQALALYREAYELGGGLRAARGIAATLRNRGDYDEAHSFLDQAIDEYAPAPREQAALWLEKGWVLSRQGRFDDAIAALARVLDQTDEDVVRAEAELQLARAQVVVGRSDVALNHALVAVATFERMQAQKGLATALRILGGDIYGSTSQWRLATAALRRGLDIATRIGSVEEIAGCLINLGIAEAAVGNVEESIRCDERAIQHFARAGLVTGEAIGRGNLAEHLLAAGRVIEALESCAEALSVARAIGDLETVADVTRTVAAVRQVQGNFDEAAAVAEEAANLYLEMGAVTAASEVLDMAAAAASNAGDEERARRLDRRARSLLVET
jgi:adenylate cyclase